MKKRVIICLNPFESHFLPMIPLAKHLKNRKYDIIFLGFDKLEQKVNNAGFEYISIPSVLDEKIQTLKKDKKFKEMESIYKSLHQEISEKFDIYRPDFILMGISRFHLYLIPALGCNSKIYLYSLCSGIPFINIESPPITSDYISEPNILGKMNNLRQWFNKWKRKGINKEILYEKRFYPWNEMKKICRQRRIKWRFGIDGYYPDFPVLIFGSKFFEFCQNKDLYYLGVDIREEDQIYKHERKNANEKLIYCSFGTMNNRYEKFEEFIVELLEVFREKPQWKLILSIGNKVDCGYLNIPNNVEVFEFAPQIAILKHADLVITHGGYGTVKECIFLKTPMLVLPCIYDQRGNAARIQYLKIGIRDLMLEINGNAPSNNDVNKQHIKELIVKVLSNPMYQENINEICQKIEKENELECACERLF